MHLSRTPLRLVAALLLLVSLLAACGDSSDEDDATDAVPADTTAEDDGGSAPTDDSSDGDATDDEAAGDVEVVADACALLDADFLDDAFEGVEATFGGALDFNEPFESGPSEYCLWPAGGGLSLGVLVEDASTAETDDHSGRAYNIDEEPVVEPQDGPGTKAVLLKDDAFADVGGSGITYGYFFVQGDVAVFIESTGFDAEPEPLRVLAEEANARLLAG